MTKYIRITKRDKLLPVDENLEVGQEVVIYQKPFMSHKWLYHSLATISSKYGTYRTSTYELGSCMAQGYKLKGYSEDAVFEIDRLFIAQLEPNKYPLIKVTMKQLQKALSPLKGLNVAPSVLDGVLENIIKQLLPNLYTSVFI